MEDEGEPDPFLIKRNRRTQQHPSCLDWLQRVLPSPFCFLSLCARASTAHPRACEWDGRAVKRYPKRPRYVKVVPHEPDNLDLKWRRLQEEALHSQHIVTKYTGGFNILINDIVAGSIDNYRDKICTFVHESKEDPSTFLETLLIVGACRSAIPKIVEQVLTDLLDMHHVPLQCSMLHALSDRRIALLLTERGYLPFPSEIGSMTVTGIKRCAEGLKALMMGQTDCTLWEMHTNAEQMFHNQMMWGNQHREGLAHCSLLSWMRCYELDHERVKQVGLYLLPALVPLVRAYLSLTAPMHHEVFLPQPHRILPLPPLVEEDESPPTMDNDEGNAL